jgi:hypothetical protein
MADGVRERSEGERVGGDGRANPSKPGVPNLANPPGGKSWQAAAKDNPEQQGLVNLLPWTKTRRAAAGATSRELVWR